MKHFFRKLWVGFGVVLLSLPVGAVSAAETSGALKVRVNVPPTWQGLVDERTPGAVTARIRETLYRAGFTSRVEELRAVEDPTKIGHLLTIDLTEWRIDRAGRVACTFGARLRTPLGTRELGAFTGTTLRWLDGTGPWGLTRSLERAAGEAVRDLCDAVAKSELLPTFQPNELYSRLRPPSDFSA